MTALRILTVDDEALALRRLQLVLQGIPNVVHVGEAASCREAMDAIGACHPDIILLDIRMRDGDGFEVAAHIARLRDPAAIIFVTAFDQFAIRAFECAAVDYLLKPVERERLAQAIERAAEVRRVQDSNQRVAELESIIRNLRSGAQQAGPSPYDSELWLRGSGGLVRVPVDTISCVSSEDDYVAIQSRAGVHLMRSSLRQFESRVEPGQFVRLHRKWLVRRSEIAELRMSRFGRKEAVLQSGRVLPVGRVYLKSVRDALRTGEFAGRA